jgi:hypothetical protein
MTTGLNSLVNVSLPSAWDATELRRLTLRDGTSYEALIRDINDALGLVNASLQNSYLANFISLTTEPTVEYRNGVSNGFEDSTEFAQPDAKRAEVTGHMLPIADKDRKLGWTAKFLRDARRSQIDADIASLAADVTDLFEKMVLTRLFKMEEETGKRYGLGSSGYSVPFADGGGGTIAFTPPPVPNRASAAFASSHDHFLRVSGITQANLLTAVAHLWEHGHDGPYDLLVSLADITSWTNTTNVTGYVPKGDPLIAYGQDTDLAKVAGEYVGAIKTEYGVVRLVALGRIPTTIWGVTKSYGKLDQRNPLRFRYDELVGFGAKLAVATPINLYPLAGAIAEFRGGVGVGEDRTAAVLVENDSSGDYATPTIG